MVTLIHSQELELIGLDRKMTESFVDSEGEGEETTDGVVEENGQGEEGVRGLRFFSLEHCDQL